MKRLSLVIILGLVAMVTFNCQHEAGKGMFPGPGNNGNNKAPITATIQGNVLDENGQPANGVTIKVGTKTATTNGRGFFRIVQVSLDKYTSLVSAEKTGYFKAFRTFGATSGANQVVIKLMKKTVAGTVSASAGGAVTLSNGSKVVLPANGVVKAIGGGSYTGTVNVYVAYIDPTAADIGKTVPGSFLADDKDNNRVLLASYGMLAVELESSAGEKLQVATGSTATLTTPIPTSLQGSAPSTIKLWYVDEQTGLWKEEGTATKTGTNYVGDVKHFTYWNCDVQGPRVQLTATIKTPENTPFAGADVRIRPAGSGYYSSAHGYTDSSGQINGPVPANIPLVFEVFNLCGNVIYSQNIGPYTSDVNLGTITLPTSTLSLITIKGKLLNCSNTPLANGTAIVYYGGYSRYLSANSNGEFAVTFTMCTGAPVTCEVTGADPVAQQQGSTTTVTLTPPVTDVGNIIACGTSTLQYINYVLDGTTHNISSASSDSLFVFSQQQGSTVPFQVIMGAGGNTGSTISFNFSSNGTAGSSPMTSLRVENYTSITLLTPSEVMVTNYPQSGTQYYEGSFSALFKDAVNPIPTHTVTGTFRLRRF